MAKKWKEETAINNNKDEFHSGTKQAKHKRLHTVWFNSYKIQREAQINYNIWECIHLW